MISSQHIITVSERAGPPVARSAAGDPVLSLVYMYIFEKNHAVQGHDVRWDHGNKRAKPYYIRGQRYCLKKSYQGNVPQVSQDIVETPSQTGGHVQLLLCDLNLSCYTNN